MPSNETSRFTYVTFIRTTPEQLWEAITKAEKTKQYFYGTAVESDWKVGASVRHIGPNGQVNLDGKVNSRAVDVWRAGDPDRLDAYLAGAGVEVLFIGNGHREDIYRSHPPRGFHQVARVEHLEVWVRDDRSACVSR